MDLAELGIKVDSSGLDATVKQLSKLPAAAAGAASAADKLSKAVEGMSVRSSTASVRAAQAVLQEAKASRAKLAAVQGAKKEDIAAANATVKKAQADLAAAKAAQARSKATLAEISLQRQATKVTDAATLAIKKQDAALGGIASGVVGRGGGRRGQPANDLLPNRFNTANIAAQFQDIGVTAAMGMNPLTIALQQGTQLSAILNTMESPLKGIAIAFRSIINPVSLLSIGIVALIAAGLQLLDWTAIGKSALNGLADAIEMSLDALLAFTPAVIAAGIAFTIWNIPSIIAGVVNFTKAIWGATSALIAMLAANPFALLILGVSAALTAAYVFRDELTRILGFDLFEATKKGVNLMLSAFMGLSAAIVSLFSTENFLALIGGAVIEVGNFIIRRIEGQIKAILSLFNTAIQSLGGKGFEIDLPDLTIDNPYSDVMNNAGKAAAEAFAKGFETDYVGEITGTIEKGARAGIKKLRNLAAGLGAEEDKKKRGKTQAELYEDLIKSADRRIASLTAEKKALMLTELEASKLKNMTDLLNSAQQKGIILNSSQIAELDGLAGQMAKLEEETRRTKEAFDLIKNTGRGFFEDLKDGLREGKGLFQSFADAAINALNRIADKFFETSLDMVFNNITSSSKGGGLLSSVTDFLFNAKGNAFDRSGVQKFAKGSAFTNSIVTSPTLFKFANGSSFGEMGEAGPEAIMPLKRGADGSLGVQVHGASGGGGDVTVNVINNSGSQARTEQRQTSNGTEIDVIIDDIVASKIGSSGSSSNRALREANDRSLIRRR